jgi:DNA modification methylase
MFATFSNHDSQQENTRIIRGDVRKELLKLPDNSVQCVVTSPPYWGVRDYGVAGQIGAEPVLQDYVNTLVEVFREVRRVLRPDGTFWLNIANTYSSGGRTWRDDDAKNKGRGMSYRPPTPEGLKPKDLIGVAWMVAMGLQLDGWYLRNDIIWQKPNCQPESVKDRLTVSHEYLFMFSKEERYWFDQEAIREPRKDGTGFKNRRSVWSINTEAYAEAHFAVFPTELVRLCILAGSGSGDTVLDPFFGAGTVGLVATELGRRCIGIELNEDYVVMARRRISAVQMDLDDATSRKLNTPESARAVAAASV